MSPFHLDDDSDIDTILRELKLWLEEHQESTLDIRATDKSFRVEVLTGGNPRVSVVLAKVV